MVATSNLDNSTCGLGASGGHHLDNPGTSAERRAQRTQGRGGFLGERGGKSGGIVGDFMAQIPWNLGNRRDFMA